MASIEGFNEKFEKVYDELENGNFIAEQEVYDLEQKIEDELIFARGKEQQELIALQKKINSMKKEFDFFNEEAELDNMFPNRHDEDFDEDSMSYDIVFGED